MFILRRISGEGIEMNQTIGLDYTIVYRETNAEEFRRTFEQHFEKPHVADLDATADHDTKNVFAFVCLTSFWQPLYKNQQNYIMTESGKTFHRFHY